MHGAMHGLADGLDPDSAYLDVNQVKVIDKGDLGGPAQTGLELTRQHTSASSPRATARLPRRRA